MKRFLELVFAVVVMAMTFAASADLILVPVEKDYPGAFSKTVDGQEFWFITLDDATKYEVGYDSSWWYKPEKSNVTTTPANIKKPDGTSFGEIDITTEDTPETLETKIRNTLKQHSVEVAYSAAAVALAKAMWSELQAKVIREQIDTMAKSMQANLLNIDTSDFFTFTDDNNNNYKCLKDSGLVKASGTNSKVSQLKTLRDMLGTAKGKDITITKGQLIREGVGTLSGGGGGIPGTDGVSVTNMKFWVNGKQTNELALAGWWENNYKSNNGPSPDFICDFTLDEMTKPVNEQDPNFKKHYILTREDSGKLHYMPMTNQLKVAVKPDNISIQTNDGVVALYAFTNETRNAGASIAQILQADREKEPYIANWQTNAYFVSRTKETDGTYQLWYWPIGELAGNKPDKKSINLNTVGEITNRLQIAGFDTATNKASQTAGGSGLADIIFSVGDSDILVPTKSNDTIIWMNIGNYNVGELISGLEAHITTNKDGRVKRTFEIAGWSSVTNVTSSYKSGEETLAEIQWQEESITTASTNLCVLVKDINTGEMHYVNLGTSAADKESLEYAKTWRTNAEGQLEEIKALQLAQWGAMTNMAASFNQGLETMADYMLDPASGQENATTNMLFIAKNLATGEIVYVPFGSIPIDAESLSVTVKKDEAGSIIKKVLELEGWSSITNQAQSAYSSIADILGGEGDAKQAATNLMILAKNLTTRRLEYIILGDLSVGVDGKSIASTNVLDETTGKSNTIHMIYGFLDAAEGQVPMKVKAGDDDYQIVWTNVAARASNLVDGVSIQTWRRQGESNDVHMVKGFIQEEAQETSLDEMLAEKEKDEDDEESTDKIQVLARKMPKDATLPASDTNGFSLVYLDIKNGLMTTNWKRKVTGPDHYNGGKTYLNPSATNNQAVTGLAMNPDYLNDGHSISTNGQSLLQLVGFDTAPDNTYPLKRSGNWAWATPRRGDSDYTATASGVAKRFSIETIDTETYTNMLQLSGFGTTLKNQMMYVDVDGSDREIKWTNTPAPDSDDSANVYGKSIEKHIDVDDNIAYWGLKGYMTATENQVPYKKADGTLGWKEVAGGADVDDTSITTNYTHGAVTDKKASIYGFRMASAGDVPHKKADGSIEWKPVAGGGGALIVEGTSETTVTTATCTNKLSFVSASDSNVKFTVTDEGNGNVKVTIGVYWK